MSSLDGIRVAKPCPASWSEMEGDDKVRHCSMCNLNVYNLTAMSRAEAEALIAGKQGRLCVRYYRRDDGRIMTSDCPRGVKQVRRRRQSLALGGMLSLLVNAAVGAGHIDVSTEAGSEPIMGKMAVSPVPAPRKWSPPTENVVMGAISPMHLPEEK